MILINSNTRQFNVPGSDLVFGVVADSDAERKHFQCPRYVGDGLDLAACFIRINYRNANGKTDFYLVDDMAIDGDNITFSWLLSPKVTEYRGQVKFVMCAVGPDLKLKWHTTQGTGQVHEGLEPDNSHVESQTADVVAQLIAMVEAQTTAVEKVGADQVAAVKATAKTAQDNAVTTIETAGKNTRDSIPADYTTLSDAMRRAAPGIECSADGEVITLNDASDNPLRGMRIFGKSTQDGTPTPENPVEIVSVGDGGDVVVDVFSKNALRVNATSKTLNGVTFNVNADKSITVNGTASEQTVFTLSAYDIYLHSDFILSGCPKGGNETTYSLVASYHDAISSAWVTEEYDIGEGLVVAKDTTKKIRVSILIRKGVTASNLVFCPMLRLETALDATYEQYSGQRATIATPNSLPGIPVTSGGNYTNDNGQQWICDEVDFERGVYVRRVGSFSFAVEDMNSNENYPGWRNSGIAKYYPNASNAIGRYGAVSMCNIESAPSENVHINTTSTGDVMMIPNPSGMTQSEWKSKYPDLVFKLIVSIPTPVETPLSETELAAYRAMHTNKPNTTIINDSGAYMSVDYTADTKLYIDNKIKEALL